MRGSATDKAGWNKTPFWYEIQDKHSPFEEKLWYQTPLWFRKRQPLWDVGCGMWDVGAQPPYSPPPTTPYTPIPILQSNGTLVAEGIPAPPDFELPVGRGMICGKWYHADCPVSDRNPQIMQPVVPGYELRAVPVFKG